jgi:hypothetical protein
VSDSIPEGWTQGGEEMPEPLRRTVIAALKARREDDGVSKIRVGDTLEVVAGKDGKPEVVIVHRAPPGKEFKRGWEAAREAAALIVEAGESAERDYERGGWQDTRAVILADYIRAMEPPADACACGATAEDTPASA